MRQPSRMCPRENPRNPAGTGAFHFCRPQIIVRQIGGPPSSVSEPV